MFLLGVFWCFHWKTPEIVTQFWSICETFCWFLCFNTSFIYLASFLDQYRCGGGGNLLYFSILITQFYCSAVVAGWPVDTRTSNYDTMQWWYLQFLLPISSCPSVSNFWRQLLTILHATKPGIHHFVITHDTNLLHICSFKTQLKDLLWWINFSL